MHLAAAYHTLLHPAGQFLESAVVWHASNTRSVNPLTGAASPCWRFQGRLRTAPLRNGRKTGEGRVHANVEDRSEGDGDQVDIDSLAQQLGQAAERLRSAPPLFSLEAPIIKVFLKLFATPKDSSMVFSKSLR